MNRVLTLGPVVLIALGLGCSGPSVQPGEPPGEDLYYALALNEGLDRALQGFGHHPLPAQYCVAISGGDPEPDWQGARAPSEGLIERLNSSERGLTFHSFTDCTVDGLHAAPDGEHAGLLWVEPLRSDRQELTVGWNGFGDGAGWTCGFQETDGVVEATGCYEWWTS